MFQKTVLTLFAGFSLWTLEAPSIFADTVNSANSTAVNSTSASAAVASLGGVGGNPVWVALKLLLSLSILIVLVIFTIRFLAKRTGVGRAQGDVQVLAARQLAPGKSVQVIETHGKRLLIGVGDQITVLAKLNDTAGQSDSFADLLSLRLEELRGTRTEGESTEP